MTVQTLRDFLKLESSSGLLLIGAMVLALLGANTPLSGFYSGFLQTPVEVKLGALELAKPLLLWINDGLMAIFFLLVGLEVKREVLEGGTLEPAAGRSARHRRPRRNGGAVRHRFHHEPVHRHPGLGRGRPGYR